ncbi:MAG: class I SAM-dependent methyltransferase [Acidobacteria bacterium]|nr:MAG: class I SAM-dependent methyltransferase [Acidobacteriota bacterium]
MNEHFVRRTSCPACDSPVFEEVFRTSYTAAPIRDYLASFYSAQGGVEFDLLEGADYALAECHACGLIFQREIPGPGLSLKLYEEWIDPEKSFEIYEAPRRLSYFLTLTDEIANLLQHFDRAPGDLRVLDVGMGWGFWCRAAIGLGCEAYGVDISPSRVENAARRGVRVLSWEAIPDGQFDLINADQVFEHLPRPLETLRQLRRALKPGGLLKISVPDGRSVKRNLEYGDWLATAESPRSLNPVAPLEHINCFTRHVLIAMAAAAGLRPTFVPERITVRGPAESGLSRLKAAAKLLLGRAGAPFNREGTRVVFVRAES